jgi:hypothetical protein
MGALYTGRGPVCGITTRRTGGAGISGALGAIGLAGDDAATGVGVGIAGTVEASACTG